MEADSELKLYSHVEFLSQKSNPRQQAPKFSKSKPSKNARKRKAFQAASFKTSSNKSSNIGFKLTPNELFFIPKSYDPTPLRHPTTNIPNDFARKRKYMENIKDKGPNEQRQLRANQDKRYMQHKANELSLKKSSDERMLCLDHLNGHCKAVACDKYHQLRNPRLFGVCKYFLMGSCRDGDSCPFMHEEFPCRYYHLNMPHPKSTEIDKCRFKHGGPLLPQLRRYFKKQLEEWVRKLTAKQPQQFETVLMNYTDKFDEKQCQLEQEYGVKDSHSVSMSTANEQFSFEHILSANQIKALAKRNVTNLTQVNQIPVDDLIDCGLTMDQIYKITINTCTESNSNLIIDHDGIESNSHNSSVNEQISNDSISSIETDSSFEGFGDIELTNAVQELQCKKVIVDEEKSSDLNICECSPGKTDNIANDKAVHSDDSNDSDDDSKLTIDEDDQ